MKCDCCANDLDDELIEVEVWVDNGNNDEDNELNNYDKKTISVCCVCVAHNSYKEYKGVE
tara:strand:+ start:384 stop:563 length:180 start_codon:yes stop_codon:yes gene_type:complete